MRLNCKTCNYITVILITRLPQVLVWPTEYCTILQQRGEVFNQDLSTCTVQAKNSNMILGWLLPSPLWPA